MQALFETHIQISFGHCDPAGIVYYPNYFRWFDRCFHAFLAQRAGGHKALCAEFGAVGLGLIDVSARFPAPGRPDDRMVLAITGIEWARKTFSLHYTGRVDGRMVVEGTEIRGCFVARDGSLRAAPVAALQARLSLA
jgi:acyl-CoA thioesterase FadM